MSDPMLLGTTYSTETALPDGAAAYLDRDNPRLTELRRRYAALDSPLSAPTLWNDEYRTKSLDLAYFRGDNVYVWQQRHLGDLRLKLFVYLAYIEQLDERGLLGALGEDGAFGCFKVAYEGHPPVSRDLLDSVNELYFLDRVWQLFTRPAPTVLDIGAGYGRLAHRMAAAVPSLRRYYCVDAIAESTFLCEYYLRFRGVDGVATSVPLDELENLPVGGIDLAINIHSFSEMSGKAIAAWMRELVRLDVRSLLVIPNDGDGLFSWEADGSRPPAEHHILDAGFTRVVVEPIFRDPNLPELLGVDDKYFFYARR